MKNLNLDITLDDPISYKGADGLSVETNILSCRSPDISYKYAKHTAYLKQQFLRALKQGQENNRVNVEEAVNNTDALSEGMPPTGFIMILNMSEIDVFEYQEHFKKMICGVNGVSELVKINDELALTTDHFEAMSGDNRDQFMSEYITFFLVNSLMKKQLKS